MSFLNTRWTTPLALVAVIQQTPTAAQLSNPSSTEQQQLQQMQAREDARGWRTFDGYTYYAWKDWQPIAPDVRATAYKFEAVNTGAGGLVLPAHSGRVSVSCRRLARRYWEQAGLMRWGPTNRSPARWGPWINAGSSESTLEADAMVAALCASVPNDWRVAR